MTTRDLIASQYKFIKVVGTGTSGRALLVQDTTSKSQTLLVLKEIRLNEWTTLEEKMQAKKEIGILSMLSHPNVIRYLSSFEDTQHLYIAMEYADGGDLYSFLRNKKACVPSSDKGSSCPMDESLVRCYFHQICLAIQYLHQRKILHRDLKTKNIFLTGHQSCIKLGDFGIARFLNGTMELASTAIGTPYYLSPEICAGQPYGYKSDVWALGCVLYELLTLTHAFDAKTMQGLVSKIVKAEYPPVPA
jgi:NIMA (never in mitosis gene a)-related kinase 1/4/5